MTEKSFRTLIKEAGLRLTPQRIAVMEALSALKSHPTAEQITEYVRIDYPDIATGTIYKILESFVEKGIIARVKTNRDVMRYDSVLTQHHHLYSSDSKRIEDYYNEELSAMIRNYFIQNQISDFEIEDVKLQIIGKFINEKNSP